MQELDFKVTVDEANLILEGLGHLPFKQVFQLVAKLQQQASEQLGRSAELSAEGAEAPAPALGGSPDGE